MSDVPHTYHTVLLITLKDQRYYTQRFFDFPPFFPLNQLNVMLELMDAADRKLKLMPTSLTWRQHPHNRSGGYFEIECKLREEDAYHYTWMVDEAVMKQRLKDLGFREYNG